MQAATIQAGPTLDLCTSYPLQLGEPIEAVLHAKFA